MRHFDRHLFMVRNAGNSKYIAMHSYFIAIHSKIITSHRTAIAKS